MPPKVILAVYNIFSLNSYNKQQRNRMLKKTVSKGGMAR